MLYTSFVVLSALTIVACDDDDPTSSTEGNLVEVAQSDSNFTSFVPTLDQAGLLSTLEDDGPFTVFAPTNIAFNNLPDGFLEGLSDEELTEIISYHIVQNEIGSGDFESEQSEESLFDGAELYITSNGALNVNDVATVTGPDIQASNGVIHSIDQVLLPDEYSNLFNIISKRYILEDTEQIIRDAGLVNTLQQETEDGYTVFVPENEAFNNLPEDTLAGLSQEELQNLLTYHVLNNTVLSTDLNSFRTVQAINGDSLLIQVEGETINITDNSGNTYEVVTVDLVGTNGVVHIINGVLIPNSD